MQHTLEFWPPRKGAKLGSKELMHIPPGALDGLSDDLVLHLFLGAPFETHGTLHAVCCRLKTLLRSREFRPGHWHWHWRLATPAARGLWPPALMPPR